MEIGPLLSAVIGTRFPVIWRTTDYLFQSLQPLYLHRVTFWQLMCNWVLKEASWT